MSDPPAPGPPDRYADAVRARRAELRGARALLLGGHRTELHSGLAAGRLAAHRLTVPAVDWLLSPLLAVVPMQLLAYELAVARGLNVDQPRNLAKTVTVE